MAKSRSTRTLLQLLLALGVLAGIAWWKREPLLRWYFVRGLIQADEASRADWARRVAALDATPVSDLLDAWRNPSERICANVQAGLAQIADRWRHEDPRTRNLLENVAGRWNEFSLEGRRCGAGLASMLLRSGSKPGPAGLLEPSRKILAASKSPELLGSALELASALAEHDKSGAPDPLLLDLAREGLKDKNPDVRARAVRLCGQTSLRGQAGLLSGVAPLLRDPAVPVRLAAVEALCEATDIVYDYDLFPLLHDADAGICRATEEVLRKRGLKENHILLGYLISDPRPAQRLQLVNHMSLDRDLPVNPLLLRLSHDPAPAVRAAAVRAAYQQPHADLRGRMTEMAREDPSPTVRQLAIHYLRLPPVQDQDD
jgi:hypothetical protein